jgi:predicted nucleic acid-binding protein
LRLYLDNNVYNRPFDDQSVPRNREEAEAVRRLLLRVSAGEVGLVSSFVVEIENALSPFDARREEVSRFIDLAKERVGSEPDIVRRAKDLEGAGMRGRDALHLAVAERAAVDYFVTCDDKLLRKARRISCSVEIVLPTELPEEGTV